MDKNYIESNVLEYTGISNVFGCNVKISGENENTYYQKQFRYSSDKILWSDYKELTNKNLSSIKIYDNTLYIQYRFTQVGEGKLSVDSISLDVDYKTVACDGIPVCHWSTYNQQNRYMPQIVFNNSGNTNLFNPYSVGSGYMFYNQLSTLVSNMFGICVEYFKTEPNARTRDVVLKEYSIEHVVDNQNIKIMIPDNQLPTRELQFNTMMIDYPVQFEVHIVKSEFYKVFGEGSHPDPHDYLYMQAYMNKMYMVDAVSEPDDFGYMGSYWRVSLVPYQEMSSVKFADENLLEETESLIFSAEGKFEEEMKDEIADNRKDNQLNPMGDWQEGQDFLRRGLDPNVRIREERIYNDWTVISQQYYDLSTIDKGEIANEYKYTIGFSQNDERMFSFLIKPFGAEHNKSENILIDSLSKGKKGIKLKLKKWDNLFVSGNYVNISRTNSINGWKKIIKSSKKSMTIEIEEDYNDNIKLFNCAKLTGYEVNEFLNIRNENEKMFDIAQMDKEFRIHINDKEFIYKLNDFNGFENKWYAVMIGMNRGMSNLWLYEISGSEIKDNQHSKFKFITSSSCDIGKFDLGDNCYYDIMSCNIGFTNFRLWSKLCEENERELLLSQYVIDDTHNTLIVDNAQNELLLNNKWS